MDVAQSSSLGLSSDQLSDFLWSDGNTSAYRFWLPNDNSDKDEFTLIASAGGTTTPETARRLLHEYGLRDLLESEWALRPRFLVKNHSEVALVVERAAGRPLEDLLQPPLAMPQFLGVAIAISAALGRMHGRGLVHQDIKPSNVIFDPTTNQARLTGFGIASNIPRDRRSPQPPEHLAGTLAYMAPEQTGRMNRSIDSRSDLYSLGVLLYRMATGVLPFVASDPMEWVHCQIARQPATPREQISNTPEAVSAIIMKLLAKTADERYQTALGLERDLRRCLSELKTYGRIEAFALGKRDSSDRLLIPEKLYGRAGEIGKLLAAFDRIMGAGRAELVLVSGYSGIGKSSVVNELHRPLVPPRGFFASGKFDQYKRDIPYATLAQAFQSLIRPILAKNEEELSRWRDAIRVALGSNGQLMVDLVPELRLIIGDQPPVPDLPPQEAESRFQSVFRNFIGAFTREHPLALFLDDLQWLDTATLALMEDLLTHPEVKHLMLIGAYRDNEVGPGHPLMRRLHAMRQAGATVLDIVLTPLSRPDLEELIVDSLHCEPGRAELLAELVEEKTQGNPFFAIQFISALYEQGLLTFDHGEGRWLWDIARIHTKGYTDNVVDLMVEKLTRLPVETQAAVRQLACLGNSADFGLLCTVYQESTEEMHRRLWPAVRAGLILRSENAYRFLHDRVQEAAYSLIPEEHRAEAHLRIGLLMVARASPEELAETIFEVVNQLNRGSEIVTSAAERQRIAEFNLVAGRRAKASTAYVSALKYLHAARALLSDETWDRNHDLVFSLEYLLAECELFTADTSSAEDRLSRLADRASSAHDIAIVTRLRMTLYLILGNSRGIEVFVDYQRRLGNTWSPHPTDTEVRREYDQIMSLVETQGIEKFIDLPLITNPDVLDLLDVFTEVVMTAIFTDANLLALVLCRMVKLSLEHGNSDASCFAYVSLGTLAGSRFGNYETGYQLGKLGYDLVEKHGLQRYKARVYLRFALCIMPWRRHVNSGRALIRRAFDAANAIGDLTFAAYSGNFIDTLLLATGDPLGDVQEEAENGLAFAQNARFVRVVAQIRTQLALVQTLRGMTNKFGSFDDGEFEEVKFESYLSGNSTLAVPECWYWIRKLQARFFAGDYASAVKASLNAEKLLWSCDYYFEVAEYHFYSALARAAALDPVTDDARPAHHSALTDHYRQLAIWAENCPENFENRAALVGAEIARIEGRELDAMQLYEQAIASAHANGFVHNEAVAAEVAGRFYLGRGIATAGIAYLHNARDAYDRWGAHGKVKQLDERYPRIRTARSAVASTMIGPSAGQFDMETVVKASQALSGEMALPKLVERLMRIAVEHAGADRGLLILSRESNLTVEAEATIDAGRITVSAQQTACTATDLPQSMLRYAIRTRERVLLDDASLDPVYSHDDYIRLKQARSVLCLPIVNQAKLIGVLYLENRLAPGAFTANRVAILEMLASQAAISLENAALYSDLQRSETFLSQGQRIAHTGNFGWNVGSGEYYWSDELYNILEYDRGVRASVELALQRIHPDDRDRLRELLDRAMGERKEFDSEHRFLMPDGRIKHVHVSGRAVDIGNLEFVGAVRDVTERVKADATLRRAQADLAHVARVATLNAMTASIAHEVSQPLAGMLTNANTSLRMLNADPPNLTGARETARRTIRDANRATDVIQRLRQMFSNRPPSIELVHLNDAIWEVVALSGGELQRNGVVCRTDLADTLPLISADRVQLQQVILNLLLNAADAMAEVEDRPRVLQIKTNLDPDGSVRLAVLDSGTGIDPNAVERLFEPFYTTKAKGMGIGLSICRSIIEGCSGRLWGMNNDGPGATFGFCIPAASASGAVRPDPQGLGVD